MIANVLVMGLLIRPLYMAASVDAFEGQCNKVG
jgi:hypothetical protein